MPRLVLRRLLLAVPTLFGISLLTFLLFELTPGRLAGALQDPSQALTLEAAHRRAEIELGARDPVTGELRPPWSRYAHCIRGALRILFVSRGPHEQMQALAIREAMPRTLLIDLLALLLALAIGVLVGARLGMSKGSAGDRAVSLALLALAAVPEFLIATLLVLCCGGVFGPPLLPVTGLQSEAAATWPSWRRSLDLVAHLVLPVLALGLPLGAFLARFVRDSVATARLSEPVRAALGFGASANEARRLALRHGLVPLTTLLGALVPTCVAGSVVVEQVFSIEGMGLLSRRAFGDRDQALVMALTLIVAVATLLGLLLSDLLLAVFDPRVRR